MSKRPVNSWCCDFETTSKQQYLAEGETRVYLWGCSMIGSPDYEYGVTIDSFVDYIFKVASTKDKIYFHNFSGFDSEFLLWWLFRNGFKEEREGYSPRVNKTFTHITTDMGQHYQIQVRYKRKILIFQDSYLLIPVSIESLGKIVGVKKLKETHNYDEFKNYKNLNEVTDEELSYIHNDIEIMKRGLQHFFDMGLNKLTIASSAYSNWKNPSNIYLFERNNLRKPTDNEVNNIIDQSYRGAITYLNPKYSRVELHDVVSYDFNSMYPSKMRFYSMPCSVPIKFESLEECKKYAKTDKIIIQLYIDNADCIEGFHPFIPTKKGMFNTSYEYNRHIDSKFISLWLKEYELFKTFYTGSWSEICYVGFKEVNGIFNEYIDYWKNIKEHPKTDAEKFIAKRMLNSLYGKFGMNEEQNTKYIKNFTESEGIEYEIIETSLPYKYRAMASYITMLARVELISAIENNAKRFVYCDTDSIYLIGREIPDIPIHDYLFNHWKYEGHYTRYKALKTKCYMKQTDDGDIDIKVAGLPNDARGSLTFENFDFGFKIVATDTTGKLQKKRVKGGIILDRTNFEIHLGKDLTNN